MSLNPLDWLQTLFTSRALEIENSHLNAQVKQLEAKVTELEAQLKVCQQKLRDVWPFTPNR